MSGAAGLTAEQIERRDYTWCTVIWHEPYRWENFVIGTPVLADAKPRAHSFATERWGEPDQLWLDVGNKVVKARKAFAAGLHDNTAYESPPGRQPRKASEHITIHEHTPLFPCRICRAGQQPRGEAHEDCEREAVALAETGRVGILCDVGISTEPDSVDNLVAAWRAVIEGYRFRLGTGAGREDRIGQEAARFVAVSLKDEAARRYLEMCAAEEVDAQHWRWTRGRGKPGVGLEIITASYNPHGWRVTSMSRQWPEWEICANIVRSGPPACPRSYWRVETCKWNRTWTGYWCEEHLPDDERAPSSAEPLSLEAS